MFLGETVMSILYFSGKCFLQALGNLRVTEVVQLNEVDY